MFFDLKLAMNVAMDCLELWILLHQFLSAGIIGVYHQAWLLVLAFESRG
jgi:hypothetical protein